MRKLALVLALVASPAAAQSTTCLSTPPILNCTTAPDLSQPRARSYSGPPAQPQSAEGAFARGQRLAREEIARGQMRKLLANGQCEAAAQVALQNLMLDEARQIKELCPAK